MINGIFVVSRLRLNVAPMFSVFNSDDKFGMSHQLGDSVCRCTDFILC